MPKAPKTTEKKKKPRSPNYPAVSLKEAVRRTKLIFDKDGRAGGPTESAAKHIGYSGTHGKALSVLSALSKFGLTDNKGGRITPTKAAIEVITFSPGQERHDTALKEAALLPDIYREIVEQYGDAGELPSDESLKPELVTDWKFTPKAVDGFLEDFRESLEYAGLLVGNVLKLSCDSQENTPSTGVTMTDANVQQPPLAVHPSSSGISGAPPVEGQPYIRFPLSGGNEIEIRLKQRVSKEEFARIKSLIELSEASLVREDEG